MLVAGRLPFPRASGGIGRRAGFRCQCPKGRGGSSPPSRTQRSGGFPPLLFSYSWRVLLEDVAEVVQVPRVAPADSFVLHAPLELLARVAVLDHVDESAVSVAEARIAAIAAAYEAFGAGVEEPSPLDGTPDGLAAALGQAIAAGDLAATDRAAAALAAGASVPDLRRLLAPVLVDSLGAAAHAPIFLRLLRCVDGADGRSVRSMLRPLARELARNPEWRLTWFDSVESVVASSDDELDRALAAVPYLGVPGSDFIHPLMDQAERSGVASAVLTTALPDSIAAVLQSVQRVAARSMVQEDTQYAPYGWTHCLTMPQAVCSVADECTDPRRALFVAATHVVGFRAAFAPTPLDLEWEPTVPNIDPVAALDHDPDLAAAAAWHCDRARRTALWRALITQAAQHEDAHFVKYVEACRWAASGDPGFEHGYLAAAAKLAAYWHRSTL